MNSIPLDDPASLADLRRRREARGIARQQVEEIEKERRNALLLAFREELGATVRSASPFLVSMLEVNGTSLDDAVLLLRPHRAWPLRPRLLDSAKDQLNARTHQIRYLAAGLSSAAAPFKSIGHDRHNQTIFRGKGETTRIEVVGHSLEISAQIGEVRFTSRHGLLHIALAGCLPETLVISAVGRLVEEIVDHAALRGRQWRIVRIDDSGIPNLQHTLVIATGGDAYQMPWAR